MVHQPYTGSDCKYIQPALLNLSMVDKRNDLVIVNTKNNKENAKIHIQKISMFSIRTQLGYLACQISVKEKLPCHKKHYFPVFV